MRYSKMALKRGLAEMVRYVLDGVPAALCYNLATDKWEAWPRASVRGQDDLIEVAHVDSESDLDPTYMPAEMVSTGMCSEEELPTFVAESFIDAYYEEYIRDLDDALLDL